MSQHFAREFSFYYPDAAFPFVKEKGELSCFVHFNYAVETLQLLFIVINLLLLLHNTPSVIVECKSLPSWWLIMWIFSQWNSNIDRINWNTFTMAKKCCNSKENCCKQSKNLNNIWSTFFENCMFKLLTTLTSRAWKFIFRTFFLFSKNEQLYSAVFFITGASCNLAMSWSNKFTEFLVILAFW